MSSAEDYSELLFLENVVVCEDEIDAISAKVVRFEKDSEIPPKFFMRKIFSPHREPPCHFDPAEEKILRRKKIHNSWGTIFTDEKTKSQHLNSILALLTFQSSHGHDEFNQKSVQQVTKGLSKLIGSKSIDVKKFGGQNILVEFHDVALYQRLGGMFMKEETQDIYGYKLAEIQAVNIVNPKPCFLEFSCSLEEGQDLIDKLSSLLVTFSSKFPYLCIREPIQKGNNGSSPNSSPSVKSRRLENQAETLPSFGLMMIFTSRAQRNADKVLERIKISSEWKQVSMPSEISEEDELHFDLSSKSEVLFSVKQGSPFAGIKMSLFVNENFEQMELFYSLITGKTPLAYNKIEEGLSLRTYSLSSKVELQLVCHPSVQSHSSSNVALCFAVDDISSLLAQIPGGVRNIGEDHWHVIDPDGNSVILYSLLK